MDKEKIKSPVLIIDKDLNDILNYLLQEGIGSSVFENGTVNT